MTTHEQSVDSKTGKESAHEQLEKFVFSAALVDMARLFGAEELPQDIDERLEFLQAIASNHWDFRKGAERQAVNWNDELLDQEDSPQWKRVFMAADSLGMVESSEPLNKNPDYLVILGGANRAPLDRLRFGLEQIDAAGTIVYLGSSRAVSDVEREKAIDYAPGAETELDLGSGAIETILGATLVNELKTERDGDVWVVREYEYTVTDDKGNVVTKHAFALGTPQIIGKENSTENQRRATTYDNFDNFAKVADLANDPTTTVVSVTTGFFVPGQHLPAVQELTLRHGTPVETIGHSAEYSGAKRKPSQLLQEMKSAIDAAVRLRTALK